ncbi:hypothetical protein D1007_50719 [Hordeum vulgare]|nr:hypothetical protein D1007_50719 [Hordeum vulgare]
MSASRFFFRFLTHYGVLPHHLAAKTVLQVAVFVTLCEGFLGIEMHLDLYRRIFFFMELSVTDMATDEKRITPCGAREFFYVKNDNPANDDINLPAFFDMPPVEKLNRKSELPHSAVEVEPICTRLVQMVDVYGLKAVDLLATMVSCRVQPLRHRSHLIYQMGGQHDPCWLSRKELRAHHVRRQVNLISATLMYEDD